MKRRPFGSVLGEIKEEITLVSADDNRVRIHSRLQKEGLKRIGLPVVEMRTRASIIFKKLKLNGTPKVILDAGTGDGIYSLEYARRTPSRFIGIDINAEKIKNALRLSGDAGIKNTEFYTVDLKELYFPAGKFDGIICSDVLEHIEEDEKVLSELSRVMKVGAQAIFTFPANNKPNARLMKKYGHVRPGYDFDSFKPLVEKCGLQIIDMGEYTFFFGRLAARINQAMFRFPKTGAATFYPLLLLSKLDKIMPLGRNDGVWFLTEKR